MAVEMPRYKSADEYKPGDIVISHDQIQARIKELAVKIADKYKGKNLLIVGIMKGGLSVMSDLARELHDAGLDDQEWSLLTISMYGNETESETEPRLIQDMDINPQERHVLIVDEVFDKGKSLQFAFNSINSRNPASVETFVLVSKDGTNEVDFTPNYIAFPNVPKLWLEGGGMDTGQKGRASRHVIVGQDRSTASL